MKKQIIIVMILCLSLVLLAACGSESGSKNIESSNKAATKDNQSDAYRVIVKDESGAGVQGVMIQFCSEKACTMGETDADGIAVFEDEQGAHTIHVYSVPDGYAEDETEYELPEEYGDFDITLKAAQ